MTCHLHGHRHTLAARKVVSAAKADSTTTCWRCRLTLDEHRPHRNGRPARWQAGHTRDIDCPLCGRTHGDPNAPLAAEASTCNTAAGARVRNGEANRTTIRW